MQIFLMKWKPHKIRPNKSTVWKSQATLYEPNDGNFKDPILSKQGRALKKDDGLTQALSKRSNEVWKDMSINISNHGA